MTEIEAAPIIIVHYWRYFDQAQRFLPDEKGIDVFAGIPPYA